MRALKASALFVLISMSATIFAGATATNEDMVHDPVLQLQTMEHEDLKSCRLGGDGDPPKPPPNGG